MHAGVCEKLAYVRYCSILRVLELKTLKVERELRGRRRG
jgi:hypothetical protein